jgi:hypothetical protein
MIDRTRASINASWQTLLERYDIPAQIARDGSYVISADTINTVREARLMAKFDEVRSVPPILLEHGIQILPISRGQYILGPYETYQPLDYPRAHPLPIRIPHLDTLDPHDIHSEAEALLFLAQSGVWQEVFGAQNVHNTLQGRRVSGQFSYTIRRTDGKTQEIRVDNAQIEIDAGYETADAVFLCEAKNRHVSELHLRQLYYPFRFVRARTSKPIYPIAVVYSNQTFYISCYRVAVEGAYNSLVLDRRYAYTLDPRTVSSSMVARSYAQHPPPDLDRFADIPFPQADNFALLWRLAEALAQRTHTNEEITAFIGYAPRQTAYYTSAGRALDIIERVRVEGTTGYRLTTFGHRLLQAPLHTQRLSLMEAMMRIPCFYELFPLVLRLRSVPARDDILGTMSAHPFLAANTDVTIHRRASTVEHWLTWVVRSIDVWDV